MNGTQRGIAAISGVQATAETLLGREARFFVAL
jgi:hypothetical protein